MSETEQSVRGGTGLRRRLPRGVRLRLTLLYTVLFVAGGAVLLGITYGLVSNSLGAGTGGVTVGSAQKQVELAKCKDQVSRQHAVATTGKSSGKGNAQATQACEKAFAAGALAAQSAQRQHTLNELLEWSLVGLVGLTLVSAGLGWMMAGRALRPVRDITGRPGGRRSAISASASISAGPTTS